MDEWEAIPPPEKPPVSPISSPDGPAREQGKPPVSPEKQAASRANGKLSHGPDTLEGKEKSKFNAVKHGLTARYFQLRPELSPPRPLLPCPSPDPRAVPTGANLFALEAFRITTGARQRWWRTTVRDTGRPRPLKVSGWRSVSAALEPARLCSARTYVEPPFRGAESDNPAKMNYRAP